MHPPGSSADTEEAPRDGQRALAEGADAITAQGTETDGHGPVRATPRLVPAVADIAREVPVVVVGASATGAGLPARW